MASQLVIDVRTLLRVRQAAGPPITAVERALLITALGIPRTGGEDVIDELEAAIVQARDLLAGPLVDPPVVAAAVRRLLAASRRVLTYEPPNPRTPNPHQPTRPGRHPANGPTLTDREPMTRDTTCPHCGRGNDQEAGINGATGPEPGDVSVCFGCVEPSIYTKTGLRKPTALEAAEFKFSADIQDARDSIQAGKALTEPDPGRLPCGCRIDVVGDTFVMEPCRPDCEAYRYTLAEAKRQGKPMQAVIDPEMNAAEALSAFGFPPDTRP